MRLAARSSIASFGIGLGLGWFLSTPTGRYLLASIRDAVLSPQVAAADDDGLAAAVRSELAAAPSTWHLPQPEVVVAEGHVTLRGAVPHAEGREALLLAAAGVPGVASVVDVLDLTDATASV
jgi:BON domain